ncbi:MAG: flagellar filament capping protein FliD [Treponema sp.]|nr:flagellar filament capping protein FliD [Treponema sp.]
MAGLNIPGVTDQYKTNETVEKLMQIERAPLTREQKQLDQYKAEKDAWREVNTQLNSLRESIKTLYSYENPFNNKICTSSDEFAITAQATRSAEDQTFKIDVIQKATADRFLTDELPSDYQVPAGNYIFKVGTKQVSINWKGGTLKSFSDALNKRGNNVIKSMVIGASANKKTLLIEAVDTGKENKLIFEGKAKDFAFSSGMISAAKSSKNVTFGTNPNELQNVYQQSDKAGIPALSSTKTKITNGVIHVEPRGAFQVAVPDNIKNNRSNHITFTINANKIEDITEAINKGDESPVIPDAGFAEYEGIIVRNSPSDSQYQPPVVEQTTAEPVLSRNILYAVMSDGSERLISTPDILNKGESSFDLSIAEYEGITGIKIKNENTGYSFDVSAFSVYDTASNLGYTPNHPIEESGDCIIKYEGITIVRPTNDIDDVVPEITLNVHERTERTATITVKPDKEASKNALIEFVGKYNQIVAKINVLSQNKPEIIDELDYLSDTERDKLKTQLGMFNSDFSLTSIKSNMQSILSSSYKFSEYSTINLLAQIGIATNATGYSGSYSQSRLRGYLEIDEKKLDAALTNNLDDIKKLFGYDTDGDLIIDDGIAFKLDKQLSAYTQTGGIIALKVSTLDTKIKSSEKNISKLEDQLNAKEAELRRKYSQMEGSLNSLEGQQTTINNFNRRNNNNNY